MYSSQSLGDLLIQQAREHFETRMKEECEKAAAKITQEVTLKYLRTVQITQTLDPLQDRIVIQLSVPDKK